MSLFYMVKKVGHTATGQPSSPAAATLWTKSVESKGGISTAAGSSVNKIVHAWIGGACSGKLNVWAAIPHWGHMVKKWTKNKHLPLFNAQSFKPFNVQFQSHTLNKPLFKIPIYEQKSANRHSCHSQNTKSLPPSLHLAPHCSSAGSFGGRGAAVRFRGQSAAPGRASSSSPVGRQATTQAPGLTCHSSSAATT